MQIISISTLPLPPLFPTTPPSKRGISFYNGIEITTVVHVKEYSKYLDRLAIEDGKVVRQDK